MSDRIVQGFDLDADALAVKLRDLADAIETDSVYVDEVAGGTSAKSNDAAQGTVELTYIATDESVPLLNVVSKDVWDTQQEDW